jgi:hypothetical protein
LAASRSDKPSSRCSTITTARIDGGTDRRPVDSNRSANSSGGNSRIRSRAKNRYTDRSGSAASHQRAPVVDRSGRRSWRPRVTASPPVGDDEARSLPAQQINDEPHTEHRPPSEGLRLCRLPTDTPYWRTRRTERTTGPGPSSGPRRSLVMRHMSGSLLTTCGRLAGAAAVSTAATSRRPNGTNRDESRERRGPGPFIGPRAVSSR